MYTVYCITTKILKDNKKTLTLSKSKECYKEAYHCDPGPHFISKDQPSLMPDCLEILRQQK